MSTRITFTDVTKVPALIHHYPGPFKQIKYEVTADGSIRITFVKELNFLTYDVNFAKIISQLREVKIDMYTIIEGKEYPIRSLMAKFVNYLLDERPIANGDMLREEIISFEVTLIL